MNRKYYPAYINYPVFLFSLSRQHMFFFLIQTEQGDIFKVTLETDDDIVSDVSQCILFSK